jgi:hypothetical protein
MATLKKGSTGKEVGQLQQALVEAGLHIDSGEAQSLTYGGSTEAAVRDYQAAHGLPADGVCGPKTWASLNDDAGDKSAPPGWKIGKVHPDLKDVIAQADHFVGTVENPPGSNRGELIDALNKAAGIPLGSPWCAAFATGMYHYCEKNPFAKSIGSAVGVKDWGTKRKCVVKNGDTAMAGDIFVILRAEGHGHVGVVVADLGDKVATIEGNSGNAVKRLIRKKADLYCYVRPLGLDLTV